MAQQNHAVNGTKFIYAANQKKVVAPIIMQVMQQSIKQN